MSYSVELNGVLSYMVDVLGQEFPSKVFTAEHLIVAILDSKNSHANLILDTCLMTRNLNEIKKIYVDFLKEKSIKEGIIDDNKLRFNTELNDIMINAEDEVKALGNTSILSSEHILLSMLNPNTNCVKIQEVFKSVGIDYNFIFSRCSNSRPQQKNLKKEMGQNQIMNIIKSQINTKACSSKSEYIEKYTTNISHLVKNGKVDKLIGREKEIDMIIKILSRRKKNNIVLVGNGGCGKTSIIYGVAERILRNEVPNNLQNKEIIQLNVMTLVSGTHFRGMMEERVNGLFSELKNNKNYILFLDDMHQVVKTSTKEKDTDISSMIGEILSGGEVSVIGTTDFKGYRNGIESNPSISRKMQKLVIEPNTIEETIDIIKHNKKYYEDFHHVRFSEEVIKKTVELAERYITDRSLPDSAIDVIDLTGAYSHAKESEPTQISDARKRLFDLTKERETFLNSGDFELVDSLNSEECNLKKVIADYNRNLETENTFADITLDDVTTSISDITNIPINKVNSNEKEKIARMEEILKKSIVGQDEAIEGICRIIKRNKVGLGDKKRVLGAVLMIGPSGVGKTLIAKKLAEEIFGNEKDLIRIDMSEYSEKNSVAKLTGAAPGYVGYENGGQLTEAIKNKQHCVLLLDEIEKADQEVYNLFLQLFDEGRLTDSSGQVVNFKNVIVLMTSNIGAKQAAEFGKGSGFITDESSNKKSIIEKQLKKKFTPEFINRIDQIVHFNNLTDESLKSIVVLELSKFGRRLSEIGYNIEWDDSLVEYLYNLALKQKEYGARPIIRLIQDNVEDRITDLILINDYENEHLFKVSVKENRVEIN